MPSCCKMLKALSVMFFDIAKYFDPIDQIRCLNIVFVTLNHLDVFLFTATVRVQIMRTVNIGAGFDTRTTAIYVIW